MGKYLDSYSVEATNVALMSGLAGGPKTYTKGGELAYGEITFADNPTADDTITLNGKVVKFSASATDFTTAGSVADPFILQINTTLSATLDDLVTALNGSANASLSVATYAKGGTTKLTVTYDTYATAGNAYTLAASADTPSGATLTGGQAKVAITVDWENIAITQTDTRDQHYTLADGKEFQKKVIVLTAKGTGNAVITYNGTSTITMNTANDFIVLQFLGGDWQAVVNSGCSLA